MRIFGCQVKVPITLLQQWSLFSLVSYDFYWWCVLRDVSQEVLRRHRGLYWGFLAYWGLWLIVNARECDVTQALGNKLRDACLSLGLHQAMIKGLCGAWHSLGTHLYIFSISSCFPLFWTVLEQIPEKYYFTHEIWHAFFSITTLYYYHTKWKS